MNNIKQLEAFIQVADYCSFSKAAKGLYLTQPTISTHIAGLERELHTRLFVRNTKEVRLSEDGEKLYGYAKQMLDIEKKIDEEFGQVPNEDTHFIRIAASTIPSQYLLPKVLAKFNEKYPQNQIEILEMDSEKVVEKVLNHQADIGFNGTVLEKAKCKYIPFYVDELIVITPYNQKYQNLLKKTKISDWITTEPMILREIGSGTRKMAEKYLLKQGVNLRNLNIIANIANQETIKRSVANGMGISIISRLAVQEEIEQKRMLGIPLEVEGRGRDINVVYNKNIPLSKTSEQFIKIVKSVYPNEQRAKVK